MLVFTRTKLTASRLASRGSTDTMAATAIHSIARRLTETKALEGFKAGEIRVLGSDRRSGPRG
ncbi:MAG: hypothetical protein U0838_11325 [Chloroflexota bacterium]